MNNQYLRTATFPFLAVVALLLGGCGIKFSFALHGSSSNKQSSSSSTPSTVQGVSTQVVASGPRPANDSILVEPNNGMGTIYSFMSSATKTLDMTMYELSDPTAENILEQDAAKGVNVRVLLDQDYHGGNVNQAAYAQLTAHGVHVKWANANTIFHQKTITVDGVESCIMTLNLTSQYYSTSRDLAVFDTNAQDVAAIEQVFHQDYSAPSNVPQDGAPTGSGDLVWSPGSQQTLVNLIDSAKTSVDFESEELSDRSIVDALVNDVARGVDVKVVMEASSSWDTSFEKIVAAGGHVATYANTYNGFYIHAKFIDVDGSTVYIGSENASVASLDYNRELGIILNSPSIAQAVQAVFNKDFAGATPY